MLDPNQRSLYTALLTPPPGYVLDEAVGTTYSLDIPTLLTIPVHLSLLGEMHQRDGIAVFEALRRVLDRMTLYVQRGAIHAPDQGNELFGLLAPCMVEVDPPGEGVFHPKLWILRFRAVDEASETRLRLVVLSRNVTADRAWDLSLRLEGRLSDRRRQENQPLVALIRRLPKLACVEPGAARARQAHRMAQALAHCEFELPQGVKKLSFFVPGLDGKRWHPGRCNRLAVISPFCSDDALTTLAKQCSDPAVLVSRPDVLDGLRPETREGFGRCLMLHEAAESEDSEETDAITQDRFGLHAKVFISEHRARTRLTMGSANATNAALLAVRNIEVLVTLEGLRRRMGNIDSLLGEDGLGGVLVDYRLPETPVEHDAAAEAARRRLEQARAAIAEAELSVRCEAREVDDRWQLLLDGAVTLPDSVIARVWPVSRGTDHAVSLDGSGGVAETELGVMGPAHVTAVLAFELTDADLDEPLRFALNLPVSGLPEAEREAAILRTVLNNREGFLRYLMLLLAGEGEEGAMQAAGMGASDGRWWKVALGDELPLLEELTRAFSREPERLSDIAGMVARLRSREESAALIPEDFDQLWSVYEQALEADDE